jgi:hypothetical protein
MSEIETNFKVVYSGGEVITETGYHQPEKRSGVKSCGCSNTTDKGAYKDVMVEYRGMTYHFFHETPVVIEIDDSTCRLDKGGWDTRSTKDRLKHNSPTWIDIEGALDDLSVVVDGEKEDFYSGMIVEK